MSGFLEDINRLQNLQTIRVIHLYHAYFSSFRCFMSCKNGVTFSEENIVRGDNGKHTESFPNRTNASIIIEGSCGVSSPHPKQPAPSVNGFCVSIFTFQMQKRKQKQKQKQKCRQVELKVGISAIVF